MHAGERRFVDENLRGARFVRCDLTGAVLRGADVDGADIDSPWLLDEGGRLFVNGVDVAPFVDAELDRRFPGRGMRRARTPEGMRSAWAALEEAWRGAIERAEGLPPGSVDARVDGEWSFSQTLRHLVMAIDTWLGRGVFDRGADAYHPIGQANVEFEGDGHDPAVFSETSPTFERVCRVWAERMGQVREFLAGCDEQGLAEQRRNPWAPDRLETVASCVGTILDEGWEHLRYALRDLDVIAQREREGADGRPIDPTERAATA